MIQELSYFVGDVSLGFYLCAITRCPQQKSLGRSVVTMVQSSSDSLEVADFNLIPPKYFITVA